MSTSVTWETANGQTTGSQLVSRGQFVQIYNPLASDAMRVTCDKPCLCMQYNPSTSVSCLYFCLFSFFSSLFIVVITYTLTGAISNVCKVARLTSNWGIYGSEPEGSLQ